MKHEKRDDFVLAVVDVQEKFAPAIDDFGGTVSSIVKLITGMQTLSVPILITEQYPAGLGPTVPEISEALGGFNPLKKTSFSCCEAVSFSRSLQKLDRKNIVLCGIEAHICIYNTCRDLIADDYTVHIVADAISSRRPYDKKIALRRMESDGAKLCTVEMLLYELFHKAGTEEFKKLLKIVK